MDNKKSKLISELIVDFLVEKKITHVFDLAGGMIAFLEDAINRRPGIECFPVHHEQAAGFAAEGYARLSGNFGVAMGTSGPGATNLITAIGSCYFDSTPAMFIVGQVHTDTIKKNSQVRQEGFQETDIVSVTKSLTKYSVLIKQTDEVMYQLEKAYYCMNEGRKGPVVIDIPINLQRTLVQVDEIPRFFGSKEHAALEKKNKALYKTISTTKVNLLQKMLTHSKAPLIVVGNGVRLSGAAKELQQFVNNNNIPVVSSLLGLDSFPASHKNFVGYIGSNGNREANIVFANADLIIALGTRLDVRQTGDIKFFNKDATLVHVDIDRSSINYTLKSKLSFETDLKIFFKACQDIRTEVKPVWRDFIASMKQNFVRHKIFSSSFVDPNTFIAELSLRVPKKTNVIADVGQNQMWTAQSWNVKEGHRLLFSGGMGAMGFALPAAIGAWCGAKKDALVVISGDGGLQINIQEMETVSRNKIPLKMFILNNKSLGMVREFQDLYFDSRHQSTVIGYGFPDFKILSKAYGFDYVKIKSFQKEDAVLEQILANKNPVFIEVDLKPDATLQPKIVYGHALDDQAPYLNEIQKAFLDGEKKKLKES